MEFLKYIIPVLAVAGLCAGWVFVQILAKRLGTKNHFDDRSSGCGKCGCGECAADEKELCQN
jgi:hypothetical protein